MKILMIAATAAVLAVPALAQAQAAPVSGTTFYGNLGYAATDGDPAQTGAIQGRLGARFGQYLGAEGEVGWGVKNDTVSAGNGVNVKVKQRGEAAAYGVGFLPISPNIDLLARVGYGTTSVRGSALGTSVSDHGDSWNYGVGGQYKFDSANGVRLDFTRKDFTGNNSGKANVWSAAYVRQF